MRNPDPSISTGVPYGQVATVGGFVIVPPSPTARLGTKMGSDEVAPTRGRAGEARLFLLGEAKVVTADGVELALPRKAFALAAYLLLESPKGRLHRGDAAALLWDDSDVERRSGNFRQLLTRLRLLQANHDCPLFIIASDYISLNPAARIDVQVFRQAIADKPANRITLICDSYGGALLENHEEGGQKLLQWLRARRTTLQFEFAAALTDYLESEAAAQFPELALLAAERLLKLDATQEAAYRALMRVHAAGGELDLVHKIYARLERILRKDVQARPSAATRDLFEALTQPPPAPPEDPVPELVSPTARFLPRLVVLPPALGTAPMQQALAEVADELTLALWRTRSFVLLAPSSLTPDLRSLLAAYRARDIDYVLEIRGQRAGLGGLSLRLVSAGSGEILWAGAFEKHEPDIALIGTVVQTVVEQVEGHEVKLADQASARVAARRQAIQGLKLLQTLELAAVRRARNIMKGALATAADCIPALAGLARTYVIEGMLTATADGRALDEAESLARRAIVLDPEDYRGYQELGLALLYHRKFDSGVEMLRSAQSRNPIGVGVLVDLADALLGVGKTEEALSTLDQARQLMPVSLDICQWIAACAHYSREDYRAAAADVEAMQHPAPAHRLAAAAYAMLGEKEIAARFRAAALEFNPAFRVSAWLAVCPIGRKDLAQHYEDGLLVAGFA